MLRRACLLGAVVVLATAPAARASHAPGGPVPAVSPEYVKRLLDEGGRPVVVDLRPREDFRASHLPGALSLPLPELRRRYGEVPRGGRVILYCACPRLELHAAYHFLRAQGHGDVLVMEEGFPGWAGRRFPLEP
jgi:rhodanese-related sulfurtransferase